MTKRIVKNAKHLPIVDFIRFMTTHPTVGKRLAPKYTKELLKSAPRYVTEAGRVWLYWDVDGVTVRVAQNDPSCLQLVERSE